MMILRQSLEVFFPGLDLGEGCLGLDGNRLVVRVIFCAELSRRRMNVEIWMLLTSSVVVLMRGRRWFNG